MIKKNKHYKAPPPTDNLKVAGFWMSKKPWYKRVSGLFLVATDDGHSTNGDIEGDSRTIFKVQGVTCVISCTSDRICNGGPVNSNVHTRILGYHNIQGFRRRYRGCPYSKSFLCPSDLFACPVLHFNLPLVE